MSWVAAAVAGSAVLGAGVSMAGANKQAKSNAAAQEQNAALQREQNDNAWMNYLMTRGIAPTTPVKAGVMPTAGNFNAVNTRLPLWANLTQPVNRGTFTGVPRLVRRS